MAANDAQRLASGIEQLGINVSDEQRRTMMAYVALLAKWNRAYNLTAVRDPAQMVTRHLLDSLTILPYLGAGSLLDVGTGAGIPGLIVAICRPDQAITLLDSNGKKTRFVKQAALELGLANVTVVQDRVEGYVGSFDQICCRAFAALPDVLALCGHLLAPQGRLLAMKAHLADEEKLPHGWHQNPFELAVPGLNETRQLLVLTRQGEET